MSDFAGYNILRVWDYVTWDAPFGWASCTAAEWLAFVRYVGARGWLVEITLLTDDDPNRIEPAKRLIRALDGSAQVVIEGANEPTTHKRINTGALRVTLEESSFHYSSGDYEDSSRFFGTYLTAHTGRDTEWPRRAHDLLEYYNGGGPNALSDPAHRVPVVADEPIRPDQAGGDRERDFLAYFGTVSLLGAGGTYHYEGGKLANRPTEEEKWYADIALQALNAFPADAPKGPYRRIDEGVNSLRTYVVEPYSVRVRPKTPNHPEAGWRPIDHSGVLWER